MAQKDAELDSLYGDETVDEGGRGESSTGESKGEEEVEPKTALVSVDFLGGDPKEGEVCKVKVEAIHGDEVEISYIPHDETAEEKGSVESDIDEADETNRSRGRMASGY